MARQFSGLPNVFVFAAVFDRRSDASAVAGVVMPLLAAVRRTRRCAAPLRPGAGVVEIVALDPIGVSEEFAAGDDLPGDRRQRVKNSSMSSSSSASSAVGRVVGGGFDVVLEISARWCQRSLVIEEARAWPG